ncbi:MAG TPA: hypothetical protein VJZ76_24550 [Thermoanaerobaculia bacterium]|nr:hypothetical protein [Thermoanaerobaculia bacterium]
MKRAAVALLFLAVRIVYLYAREPFFDELYTQWMAKQPASSIVAHLLHDSGPPLYYFLARFPSVDALRWLSLVFACIAFVLVLRKSIVAAMLLAVHTPAVFYATEARAYALCAMLVAMGVLLVDEGRPFAAAIELVLAAYTHYYGVLFFPLLLFSKDRRAFMLAIALFVPGFVLAFHQPSEAMQWNVVHPFWVLLASVSIAAVLARTWRFAPAVLIPAGLALAFALAGRNVYFPMRFESVLAVPLVLWTAASLERWRPSMRAAVVAVLMVAGAFFTIRGIAEAMQRPSDPRVRAAAFASRLGWPVVASDYCYLFAQSRLGDRVAAFPSQQGEHPGWYSPSSQEAALAAARSLPVNGFVFVGDAGTPELAAVQRARRTRMQFRDGPAVVLSVEPLTSTVH